VSSARRFSRAWHEEVVATLKADHERWGPIVKASGAKVGQGNVLDHGLRVGAGQTIPDDALRFT
jgi:hypothetical protein